MWILNLNKHFNKPVIPEILKTWREVKLGKCSYWEVSGDSQRDLSGLYAEAAAEWIVLICNLQGRNFTERLVNVISILKCSHVLFKRWLEFIFLQGICSKSLLIFFLFIRDEIHMNSDLNFLIWVRSVPFTHLLFVFQDKIRILVSQ